MESTRATGADNAELGSVGTGLRPYHGDNRSIAHVSALVQYTEPGAVLWDTLLPSRPPIIRVISDSQTPAS